MPIEVAISCAKNLVGRQDALAGLLKNKTLLLAFSKRNSKHTSSLFIEPPLMALVLCSQLASFFKSLSRGVVMKLVVSRFQCLVLGTSFPMHSKPSTGQSVPGSKFVTPRKKYAPDSNK